MTSALIVVDIQQDFVPGGSLAVPEGDQVIEPLNRLAAAHDLVIATRDWHPADHSSFVERGGPWPAHCVQGTEGAEYAEGFDASAVDVEVLKGQADQTPGYSPFENPELERTLREHGVDEVAVGGLAANICVRATVLGALERGFHVALVTDATRGVDLDEAPGAELEASVERAMQEMEEAGARLVSSEAVVSA